MANRMEAPEIPARLVNVETEAAMVGMLLMDNRRVDTIADILAPEDFSEPLFNRVFGRIVQLVSMGKQATAATMHTDFIGDPALESMGVNPAVFLAQLTNATGLLLLRARDTAEALVDLAKRRRLHAELLRLTAEIEDNIDDPIESLVDSVDGAMTTALQRSEVAKSVGVDKAWDVALKEIEDEASGVTPKGLAVAGFDDWNTLTGTMRRGEVIVLAGRPGMGKAQPLDAKVLGANGWTTMGELQVGDALASIDGGASLVTGVFPQGAKQILRVTFSDGRSAECCAEHLWSVSYRDWPGPRVLRTDKLQEMLTRVRYKGRLWIEQFNGDFGGGDLPIDPWLLGFLLGDGSICGGQVRFSTKDPEIIEAVLARLPAGLSITHQGRCDYRITSGRGGGTTNTIMAALRDLGVFDTRSDTKFVPALYLGADREARMALLRGLMDSDGWAETFAAVRFSTASTRLAADVCTLVRSLGGLCSVRTRSTTYTYKGETKTGKPSHTCRIRFADASEIFSLDRKLARCKRSENTVRLNLTSIEPTRIAEAQCISVSHPSRLYVTDDFVVTHNTAVALSTSLSCARAGLGTLFISLEMSVSELMKRAISDLIFDYGKSASFENVKQGKFTVFDRQRITEARDRLASWPMVIRQDAGLRLGRLGMLIRRTKRQLAAKGQTLDVVFIDYLGLVKTDARNQKRYEEVSEISRAIKQLARELDVAIVLLAQLNREVEKREDKRPQLSDLRDSGEIEQDADVVMFVYREQYYLAAAEPPEGDKKRPDWQTSMDAARDKVELICRKVRNGATGKRVCHFFAEHQAVRGSRYFQDGRYE